MIEMVEINIDDEITDAVAEAMADYEPDYDEIRGNIEDDILGQVSDHIDWSEAEYNMDLANYATVDDALLSDDLGPEILGLVETGCDMVDDIAMQLLERAVKSQGGMTPRDFYLPTWDDWHELQAQVRALSQIIDTSSVRTSLADDIVIAYKNNEINSEAITGTIAELRNERYQAIRYLSKPDLLTWAAENGFVCSSDMKVADIHKVIL